MLQQTTVHRRDQAGKSKQAVGNYITISLNIGLNAETDFWGNRIGMFVYFPYRILKFLRLLVYTEEQVMRYYI